MLDSNKRVGLTIDHGGVRYARVRKRKKGWEIEKTGFLPFADGVILDDQFTSIEELRTSLKDWVKKERLNGTSITLAIPTSQIIIRKLQVGTVHPKELNQLINLEVETALHLPFEDPVYDYIAAGSAEQSTDVLVYASPQKWIKQCIELLESAGLKVKIAELASTAFARAIQARYKDSLENTMLIHLDKANVEVYMFHQGHPVFMRVINEYDYSGSEDGMFTPELISSINAEISRLLSFYQYSIHDGQARIVQAIIAGELAGRTQLAAELQQAQPDMRVETVELESPLRKRVRRKLDEYMIPFGLAIREKTSPGINLMPEKVRKTKQIPAKLLIAGIVWLLCLGAILALNTNNRLQISDYEHTVQVLRDKTSLLQQQLSSQNTEAEADSDPQAVVQFINEHRQDAAAVLDELTNHLPYGSRITALEYNNPGRLALTFKSADLTALSTYLTSLRAMTFAGSVELQSFADNNGQWFGSYEITWKTAPPDTQEATGGTDNNG
ncbi:pilus assembly protein PilM [Paenibacillus glycanilyticus]|uniref:pilus assembly protein PilM n=1 Tax=Paenibacillus glycanilyticus TaxID=126569 RepID=UPI002042384F|nr:pilus assembly protein PilM [Paenibacillus glycanilyticus]MCM3627153.1 pilus assembly protein PilM [Paenibacillus glycanilyticus]